MAKKKQRGKEGNTVNYTTRNQALIRLQIKLPEFRRLCILKGIHPREPKKKVHGHNKTYYHVKDINFLAHEPLLEKGREIKAHERKIKKARGRLDEALAERLKDQRPSYTLDHLVKERYPTFIDALRDLDDALTMLHLFATLPADSRHKIPASRVHSARRLSLEWQAYVTRTAALRKTFVSVKGVYYQAEVAGQQITWLVPHTLSQILPSDVDFRVMLTFLEFYETFVGFVNLKLYHEVGLAYPPVLDPKLEEAAADLYAVMRDLAQASEVAAAQITDGERPEVAEERPSVPANPEAPDGKGEGKFDAAATRAKQGELLHAESAARLASLQSRLSAMEEPHLAKLATTTEEQAEEDGTAVEVMQGVHEDPEAALEEIDDEDTRRARNLFRGLVFFLAREVPRESLLFVIRAFGGVASWEGEGAPFPETDDAITHQVVDRPSQKHRFLDRTYLQPQWLYDSANSRLLLPTADYSPGLVPPPHLSPFVDNEVEGYVPEYAATVERLRSEAAGVAPLGEVDEAQALLEASAERAMRSEEAAAAARLAEVAMQEKVHAEELLKEVAGVPYSSSLQQPPPAEGSEDGNDEEDADEDGGSKSLPKAAGASKEVADEAAMAQVMMPRKTKELYKAMQMGNAKKRANVELLEERKRKAAARTSTAVPKKMKRVAS